jgi:hypothetical protein
MPTKGRSLANGEMFGDFIPSNDSAYDLGSFTKKWKDLHLSGSTLYIGDSGSISSNVGGAIGLPAIEIGTGANTVSLTASDSGEMVIPAIKIGSGATAVVLKASASGTLETTNTSGVVQDTASSIVSMVQTGALIVTTGTKRWYSPGASNTISKIVARVSTAPAGATLNIVVNKNGSSAATLSIADGGTKFNGRYNTNWKHYSGV